MNLSLSEDFHFPMAIVGGKRENDSHFQFLVK